MELSGLVTFAIATSLLVASPGPNGVLIARIVPTSGTLAGFAAILGFFTAFYIHGTLSILGVSAILLQSAVAFSIVKFLGAAYLCWIGVKSLIGLYTGAKPSAPGGAIAVRKHSWRQAYLEGLLTNGLNPKVSMFYLAVFPQFIPASDHPVAAAYALVCIHSMINVIWFGLMVALFARLTGIATSVRFQRWLKGITGVTFIGFGIKLATHRAPG